MSPARSNSASSAARRCRCRQGRSACCSGLAFIVVGVAFGPGAVPFHAWVPDVYHGAPTPVTLFLAAARSSARCAGVSTAPPRPGSRASDGLAGQITMVAVLSIIVGNVVAIAQTNIKRMLAYSTISRRLHPALGILAGTSQGLRGSAVLRSRT
ncbi:MAG: hypothetical protein IPF84_16300 [Proteobacteria bacterium]|nr:hypothetical protein [Pseudomonadota bacterium]